MNEFVLFEKKKSKLQCAIITVYYIVDFELLHICTMSCSYFWCQYFKLPLNANRNCTCQDFVKKICLLGYVFVVVRLVCGKFSYYFQVMIVYSNVVSFFCIICGCSTFIYCVVCQMTCQVTVHNILTHNMFLTSIW